VRLADRNGLPLGDGSAGPSALGQGVTQAWRHIGAALHAAACAAGVATPGWSECAFGLGLSGAGEASRKEAFIAADPGCARLVLDTDGATALLGAHAGRPGLLLASGTGSVCEVLRGDGTRLTVGGWGWRTGDEGSGAWLGREALRHTQRALDGRDIAGPLARALQQVTGSGLDAQLAWAEAAQQAELAALVPLVFERAADDPAAERLLNRAAGELAALGLAADPHDELPVALAGSVALRLQDRLPAALRRRLVPPAGDALAGALSMIQAQLHKEQGP
jgi:glucosamine kinase